MLAKILTAILWWWQLLVARILILEIIMSYTITPWLTLLLVHGKSCVNHNSCQPSYLIQHKDKCMLVKKSCFIARVKWGMGTFWKCVLVKFAFNRVKQGLVFCNMTEIHISYNSYLPSCQYEKLPFQIKTFLLA